MEKGGRMCVSVRGRRGVLEGGGIRCGGACMSQGAARELRV